MTFIQKPTTNEATETIYDRTEIEETILRRNQTHFNQCAGTPFTVGRLRDINWAADSILADSILEGTCDTQQLPSNPSIQLVLQQCRQLSKPQQTTIDIRDLKGLFKRWRETTTTSPSGRHLGLYKAIFAETNNPNIQNIQQDITTISNTLLQHGMGLDRWRKVINMMIHKLEGSFLLNKLRVIHLFEADYNGIIGILFNRKVLYRAEQHQLLNNNQWGCRPHRQAEDALMLKELSYNLANLTKTTLATFDNDATGCFDRVPCSIAMLASQRLGANKNMCRMQADTLRHIQHQLRTAFGLSKLTYTSSDNMEIHGQGQGSRAGPPTWVFVSSLLLDCMEQQASGLTFTCPRQKHTHTRHNDAFVDNVTGYANQFVRELNGHNVLNSIIHQMQRDATLWNDLLHTSGGKLALHKCLYYIIAWEWKHGRATPIPPSNIPTKIAIQQDNNHPIPITQLPCHTAHRTLGQMKSPTGNQQAHIDFLTKRSNKWLNAIKEASLTRAEALAAFETIWIPSLSYGLGTTNITYNEFNNIQKPVVNHILKLLGYNQHFPRAVVYGSPRFGGLQFKHLYVEQGVKHVAHFVKYYHSNNSIGQLLRISLQWIRLVAGFSFCPLRRPQTNYYHITDPWFQTTIRFLSECQANIETIDPINIFSRANDSSLMEDFLLFKLTKTETILLNQCRLFLHVTTISDITDAEGNNILNNIWEGHSPMTTPYLWPKQENPSDKAWRIWRKLLCKCYLVDDEHYHKKRRDLSLRQPLQTWLLSHHALQCHTFYINPVTLQIYQRTNEHFLTFKPVQTNRTTITLRQLGRTTYLPHLTHPIQPITLPRQHLQITKSSIHILQNPPPPITNFSDYLTTLQPWDVQLIQHHETTSDYGNTLQQTNQSFTIATDGSEQNGKGSYGWIISTIAGHTIATGSGTAYGYDISSFRCEAYGILAALRFILHIRRYFHTPPHNQPITLWCDCNSLLQHILSSINDINNPNKYVLAEHDIETAIRHTIPDVSAHLQLRHLHSHQFDNVPLQSLPLPQRLNRIADSLAKHHNRTIDQPTNLVPLLHPARCQVHVGRRTVTRSLTTSLRHAHSRSTSITHIMHRIGLHSTAYNTIAWNEFTRAINSFPPSHQRILRRWIYGFLPTQRRLHRNGLSTSPRCPVCQTHIETDHHFLTCGTAASWADSLLIPMQKLFHKYNTGHWVANALYNNITRYLNKETPDPTNAWIAPAVQAQSDIGWQTIFYGMISTKWLDYQNRCQPHNPNANHFLSKLIKLILTATINRWNNRNNKLHSGQPSLSETHLRSQAKVRTLYACQQDVLASDRKVFSIPLNSMLQKSTQTLQLFIQQNTALIKQSMKQQRQITTRQHRDIASYFPHKPTENTRVTFG